MKFKICNKRYDDFLIVTGDSIEEVRKAVKRETTKRGWEDKDCYSVEVK